MALLKLRVYSMARRESTRNKILERDKYGEQRKTDTGGKCDL